jgi:hypothetical protein
MKGEKLRILFFKMKRSEKGIGKSEKTELKKITEFGVQNMTVF